MLRILADENIADAAQTFAEFGQLRTVPGRSIDQNLVRNVDILLVRSVTRVDESLLSGSQVKFVGSATAGMDHVSARELQSMGIHLAHAPGSNAPSVADYVVASVLKRAVATSRPLGDLQCAVIGCGAVGQRVVNRLSALGLTVHPCDPPLQHEIEMTGGRSSFVETDDALSVADIVTLHVPLHDVQPYSTFGLIDANRLSRLKSNAWLVNTSRGLVVHEPSVERWLADNPAAGAVFDVWENEPNISCSLAARCEIATPHIAGYATEGKLRATKMLRDSIRDWLGEPSGAEAKSAEKMEIKRVESLLGRSDTHCLEALARSAYDIGRDHQSMTPICEMAPESRGAFFDELRRAYPTRHEYSRYCVSSNLIPSGLERAVEVGLGMQLV